MPKCDSPLNYFVKVPFTTSSSISEVLSVAITFQLLLVSPMERALAAVAEVMVFPVISTRVKPWVLPFSLRLEVAIAKFLKLLMVLFEMVTLSPSL